MLKIIDRLPGMNAASVGIQDHGEFHEVEFAPSPRGGLERMWFHFAVVSDGGGPVGKIRLRLKNGNGILGGGNGYFSSFRPVIRHGKSVWTRLPEGSPQLREDGYYSVSWEVDSADSSLEAALCFPYGQPELERLLAETGAYFRCDEISVTNEERLFCRLSNSYGSMEKRPYGFYLTARQHAMEVGGAWVLDGLLRRLAERKAAFPVWVIPFMNPDAIAAGRYGKDEFPLDLNRSWGGEEPGRVESKIVTYDLERWAERVDPLSMVIDFHSPTASEENVFCFVRPEIPEEWPLRRQLADLEKMLGSYADSHFIKPPWNKSSFQANVRTTLSKFTANVLKRPAFTVEAAYFRAGGRILEISDYQEIGAIFADWMDSIARSS